MDKEIVEGHIMNLDHLGCKDHFKYLIFTALESNTLREIGWERTVSAKQINELLYNHMASNNFALVAKDGELVFTKLPL